MFNLKYRAQMAWKKTVKVYNETRTAVGVALVSSKDADYLLRQIQGQKNVTAITAAETGLLLEDNDLTTSQATSAVKGTKRQLAREARENRNEAARLRMEAIDHDEEAAEQEADAEKRAKLLARLSN